MCDMPLVWDAKKVTARKQHRCFECYGAIRPGDVYEREKGVWPDGPAEYKTCLTCVALNAALHAHPDWTAWDCLAHGELWEMAEGLGMLSWVPYEHPVRAALQEPDHA